MTAVPSVLFACRANAGRSVVAKLLAEHYAADAVHVSSAGSEPGEAVHPEVATALRALGLDSRDETPKPFDPTGRYDVVITMGCGETCPVYRGARYEDWPVDDPKDKDDATVRAILADIDGRVRRLLKTLAPKRPLPPSLISG